MMERDPRNEVTSILPSSNALNPLMITISMVANPQFLYWRALNDIQTWAWASPGFWSCWRDGCGMFVFTHCQPAVWSTGIWGPAQGGYSSPTVLSDNKDSMSWVTTKTWFSAGSSRQERGRAGKKERLWAINFLTNFWGRTSGTWLCLSVLLETNPKYFSSITKISSLLCNAVINILH